MKKTKMLVLSVLTVTLIIGCTITTPVVTTHPDGSKETNSVVQLDPRLQQGIDTTAVIGPLVPQPYGLMVTTVGSIIGLVGAGVVAFRNSRIASANLTEAQKWQGIGTSIIQGVEAAGTAAQAVKEQIRAASKRNGNEVEVHAAVQEEV